MTFTAADENRAGQPLQMRNGSLESRHRSEIDLGWIDLFTGEEPFDNLRRRVTHAGILDVNQRSIVSSERVPCI